VGTANHYFEKSEILFLVNLGKHGQSWNQVGRPDNHLGRASSVSERLFGAHPEGIGALQDYLTPSPLRHPL